MSLWGKPVTRHYVHEVPALDGQVLKMLRTLQPGWGGQWTSCRGRRIEITRQHLAGKWPTFLMRLMNGQSQTLRLESTPAAFNGVR